MRPSWQRVLSGIALVISCLSPVTPLVAAEELPVVYLSGTPYEIGREHGQKLRKEVSQCMQQVLGYFRSYLKIPVVRSWAANGWLDTAWKQALRFMPQDIKEELRGLSEGSGVHLRQLYRLHAVPERTYACANLAAWAGATEDERLIHIRNLDWNMEAGIQRFAVVFVIRPTGKQAFVSFGWAGFMGVLTGINESGLSIGQVGAETVDWSFQGEPMAFLMRRLLEDSKTLDEAAAVILKARRTVGVNYVLADAKSKRAVAVETTHRYARVFTANDPAEQAVPYAKPLVHAIVRADVAMDPMIRERQIAAHGNPYRDGLEDPSGSSSYDVRYCKFADGLLALEGNLDPRSAMDLARAVAPPSNVQSVVFAWPDVWVANAQGSTPAAQTPYYHLDVQELLK